MIFNFLDANKSLNGVNVTLKILVCLFLVFILWRFKKVLAAESFIKFFSILFLVLMMTETFIFFSNNRTQEDNSFAAEVSSGASSKANLPNVYHILLDEYQTDMFNLTLSPGVEKKLAGFTFYPNTRAVYGRTEMSLPSIMTGTTYKYNTSQIDYEWDAFNSKKSFLYWLKNAGYNLTAYMHPIYSFQLGLFDQFFSDREVKTQTIDSTLFKQLWIYSNLPRAVSQKMLPTVLYEQFENQNVLPNVAPVISREVFSKFLKNEQSLPGNNRYVLVHLLIPHFPYVLSADGQYKKSGSTPLAQATYATKLITDFVDELKRLNRFDNSLIIVEADHGARFKVANNKLVGVEHLGTFSEPWSEARSRPLLLIKPPGTDGNKPFTVSQVESSLLDVAPTTMELLNIKHDIKFEGLNLAGNIPNNRERFYHFYKKLDNFGYTDEMTRYVIKDNRIKLDKKIKLINNNRMRVSEVQETEQPKQTSNIKFYLEKVSADGKFFEIGGWALLQKKANPKDETFVVLTSGNKIYKISTTLQKRDDIITSPTQTKYGGFYARFPVDSIKHGSYKIGISIENNTEKNFVFTSKTIDL